VSLRTRLILAFLLLSVVPLSAVTLYSYGTSVEAFQRAVEREAAQSASDIGHRMSMVTDDLGRRMDRVFDAGPHSLPVGDAGAHVVECLAEALDQLLAIGVGVQTRDVEMDQAFALALCPLCQRFAVETQELALLIALHGELSIGEQHTALAPAKSGTRRVVLATNVAESSLTLPGVRAVVDTGVAREPRFDPNSGFTRLETVSISQASADQRAGRAGRLGPGLCLRLWPESKRLDPERTPEMATVELSQLGGPPDQRVIHLDVDPSAAAGALPHRTLVLAGDVRDGGPVESRKGARFLQGALRGRK